MQNLHAFVTCGLLGLAALAAPAAAEDGKAMPGSACQASFFGQGQTLLRSGASLSHNGSIAVSVTCPTVKDIEAGRIKRALVKVFDRHPSLPVKCTLATHRSDGTVQQSQTAQTLSLSPGILQTLTFAGQSTAAGGVYNLACDLPPGNAAVSTIVLYSIVEE